MGGSMAMVTLGKAARLSATVLATIVVVLLASFVAVALALLPPEASDAARAGDRNNSATAPSLISFGVAASLSALN